MFNCLSKPGASLAIFLPAVLSFLWKIFQILKKKCKLVNIVSLLNILLWLLIKQDKTYTSQNIVIWIMYTLLFPFSHFSHCGSQFQKIAYCLLYAFYVMFSLLEMTHLFIQWASTHRKKKIPQKLQLLCESLPVQAGLSGPHVSNDIVVVMFMCSSLPLTPSVP